jgi:hypothetical protein
MDIMTIVIVSTVAFLLFVVLGKVALVKVMANSSKAALTAESVLKEVEIFLAYGKKDEAIERLRTGLEHFPEHADLSARLKDLL